MNRQSVRSSRKRVILALSTGLLFIGLSSWAGSAPIITLQQSVHFLSSDGSDVTVDAGTYEVDTLVGSRLRLNAKGGTPLFLDARATTHSEMIEAPLAVTVSGDDPDVVHVVLVLPNGQALDAAGSISGARPRGTEYPLASSAQIQFVVTQKTPPTQPPVPYGVEKGRVLQGLVSPQLGDLQLYTQPQPPTFTVISYGGKCLDFGAPPQIAGAPVFIYTCNGTIAQHVVVQEINARHEVILRAGTKVIGVKLSAPPAVLSRAVDPIVRDHRGAPPLSSPPPPPSLVLPNTGAILQGQRSNAQLAAPPFVMMTPVAEPSMAGNLLLELQDDVSRQGGRMEVTALSGSASGQIFVLDGDSIILAADRTRVVKVLNNRGTNRTPLVLGSRNLADNEFWTVVATDKSNRKPTSGFVRVPQEMNFGRALEQAHWGTVIEIASGTSIELRDYPNPYNPALDYAHVHIGDGITIRGDRRGTLLGPELSMRNVTKGAMIAIEGPDVRITGLRLRGPSRDTDIDQTPVWGIGTEQDHLQARVIIDHNDISDWPGAAMTVSGAAEPGICTDMGDPRGSRPNNLRVARNFIHHNQKQEAGYGVRAEMNSFPLIEGNTFVSNRHAIKASGWGCTSYLAWNNLVLWAAPTQTKVLVARWTAHDFDVHGTGGNGFGGRAGQYFEIAGNTFLGTQYKHENFDLRGEPNYRVEFHHNVSLRSREDAVVCSDCGAKNKFFVYDNNQFNTNPNPTTRLGVGDFDGDGTDDVFLATGSAWYYAPAGNAEWRFLNAQTDGIGTLLFGDFDGDGRTDVFTQHGREWLVSWGGASLWEKINESNPALSEFRVGDFIGDKRADIFYADGQRWWISDGGVGPFVNTQDSSKRTADLGFGDFNGDGKTDVVGVESGKWKVSLNATGPWDGFPLRSALTKTMAGLIIADFNGNGRADVATAYGKSISYDGRRDWTDLPSRPGMFAAVGRFDANPGVDILFYSANGNYLGIQSSGVGAAVRHSRQDMR
jgi:hypothetical protein